MAPKNGWTAEIYRMLTLWLLQIGKNHRAHHKQSVQLDGLSSRLSIILIIFTAFSAVAAFTNIFDAGIPALNITLAVMTAISSLLATIIANAMKSLKPEEAAEKNRQAANLYSDLSNLVQVTMIIPDEKKPDVDYFLRTLTERISLILRFGPNFNSEYASTAELPNLILHRLAKRARGTPDRTRKSSLVEYQDTVDTVAQYEDPRDMLIRGQSYTGRERTPSPFKDKEEPKLKGEESSMEEEEQENVVKAVIAAAGIVPDEESSSITAEEAERNNINFAISAGVPPVSSSSSHSASPPRLRKAIHKLSPVRMISRYIEGQHDPEPAPVEDPKEKTVVGTILGRIGKLGTPRRLRRSTSQKVLQGVLDQVEDLGCEGYFTEDEDSTKQEGESSAKQD